jgi:hypothetical protein
VLTHAPTRNTAQAHQPALEHLHLTGNRLACVQPPHDARAFAGLRALLLSGNLIADWCAHVCFIPFALGCA